MTNARRIRALVVDDEPLARDMIREMLQDDSEVEIVAECSNGREAVEAIKLEKPDLVFLDVQMPELGGFEVLESFDPDLTLHHLCILPTINMPCVRLRYMPSITC